MQILKVLGVLLWCGLGSIKFHKKIVVEEILTLPHLPTELLHFRPRTWEQLGFLEGSCAKGILYSVVFAFLVCAGCWKDCSKPLVWALWGVSRFFHFASWKVGFLVLIMAVLLTQKKHCITDDLDISWLSSGDQPYILWAKIAMCHASTVNVLQSHGYIEEKIVPISASQTRNPRHPKINYDKLISRYFGRKIHELWSNQSKLRVSLLVPACLSMLIESIDPMHHLSQTLGRSQSHL